MSLPAAAIPALELAGVTKRFGATVALDGLDLRLAPGRTLGLLGANGAGKTTTLSLCLGLLAPDAGTVRVFGHDPVREQSRVLARCNFSSPYVALPHRLRVRESLTVYGRLYGVPRLATRIAELAAELDFTAFLDRPFGQLSSGERTRISLAKALINRPELLVLDEPTASLDPDVAERLRERLTAYREASGAAVLVTSHNMPEVERLCDELVILKHGRVAVRGTPAAVMARFHRESLEQVFLDVARQPKEAP